MFCEQCGKQINDDAKFCKHCGSPTGAAAEVKQEAPAFAEDTKAEKEFSMPKREKKENPENAGNGGKKILRGILIVVALVILGYVGGTLLGFGKSDANFGSGSSVSDAIPDPEYYFGLTDEHNQKNDLWRYMQLKSEENLKSAAEDYVALLQSGKYPFEMSSEEIEENGDFEYTFVYTGSTTIPDKTSFQIKVEYIGPRDREVDDNRDMVWVTIGNYEHFELVQEERSEQAEAFAAAEQQYAAAEGNPEQQKETVKPAKPKITTPTLPDLLAFIGGNGRPMDQSTQEGEVGQEYGYGMEFEAGWIAANEYVELLANDPRFQLSMQPRKAEDSETILYLKIEEYNFDYVGDQNITPATIRGDKVDGAYQYFDADVHIKIQKNGQKGTTSIVIWHSDDFTVADLGDRASTAPAGASGSGGSSVPNSNTQPARKPCPYCDDGDCDKCGGDGYLHSLASDKEDRNCPALYCNNGRCSYCGGDGWYE